MQDVGLDVRSGVHTGEVEELDHTLGGIAVHIGARVCALAGPAEVMVTSTVKELVAGSGAVFDDAGEHELKGVEGLWHTHLLRSIDVVVPPPLQPDIAAERIAGLAPPRRRRRLYVAVAVAVVIAAGIVGGILATRGSSKPPAKITLLQLDPRTGAVVRTIRDGTLGCPCGANLFAVDGTLWERAGREGNLIVVRDMATGETQRVTPAPEGSIDGAVGFGSIWLLRNLLNVKTGSAIDAVQRIDELSGRVIATIRLTSAYQPVAAWTAGRSPSATGRCGRCRATRRSTGSTRHQQAHRDGSGRRDRDADPPADRRLRVDLRMPLPRGAALRRAHAHGQDVPFRRSSRGTSSRSRRRTAPTLWLMDEQGATLTQIDPQTRGSRSSRSA